jgi:hypothetical protein
MKDKLTLNSLYGAMGINLHSYIQGLYEEFLREADVETTKPKEFMVKKETPKLKLKCKH